MSDYVSTADWALIAAVSALVVGTLVYLWAEHRRAHIERHAEWLAERRAAKRAEPIDLGAAIRQVGPLRRPGELDPDAGHDGREAPRMPMASASRAVVSGGGWEETPLQPRMSPPPEHLPTRAGEW